MQRRLTMSKEQLRAEYEKIHAQITKLEDSYHVEYWQLTYQLRTLERNYLIKRRELERKAHDILIQRLA